MIQRLIIFLLGVVALALLYFFTLAPSHVDRLANATQSQPLPPASQDAVALHRQLRIADLHSDALLWQRDPLRRQSYGHVDLPRLIEANVAVQAFSVTTHMPYFPNYQRNSDKTDLITLLVMGQRWPVETWFSPKERALFQARRLQEAALRSGGRLVVIDTAPHLRDVLERRHGGVDIVAGVLLVEGLHTIDEEVANVDVLYRAGFRIVGLTHMVDNEVGGSAHGERKAGLTAMGRRVIERIDELELIIDLAHASPTLIDDIVAMTE